MNKLLNLISIAASIALTLTFAAPASAAGVKTAPGQNKIQCFDGTTDGGYGGHCTLNSKGAKGAATLDNTDGNVSGSYSGVYTANSNMYGKTLGEVKQLSFSYTGTATAGAPRFSIPVSTDGDSTTDVWVYVSAYYCNDGAGYVDAVNDATCTIYLSNGEFFENWAAFQAAHPTWTIADDNYVFVIADEPGYWTVSGVTFGKPGK
jgi:hypothetical protein